MERRLRELCTLLGENSTIMVDSSVDRLSPTKDVSSNASDTSYE
ncbi:hypothetical protein X975_12790, partial [Stegodyphus mimosarum]